MIIVRQRNKQIQPHLQEQIMKRFILCLVGALALFVSCYNPASMGTESVTVQERWNRLGDVYIIGDSEISTLRNYSNFPSSIIRFEKVRTLNHKADSYRYLYDENDRAVTSVDLYKISVREGTENLSIPNAYLYSNLCCGSSPIVFYYDGANWITKDSARGSGDSLFRTALTNYE